MNNFFNNFIFIGKNSKIIGTLSDEATVEEMDIMLKRTMASFYGIYLTGEKENVLLTEQISEMSLKDYFYCDDYSNVEFLIKNSTNPNIVNPQIIGTKLIFNKTSVKGFTDLNIIAKVPDKEVYAQTTFQVINPTTLFEDFEIDNIEDSQINWTHSGDAEWFITEDEHYLNAKSLRSGEITSGQKSGISLDLDLKEPGTLIFTYKTSTKPFYDRLHFYIDGLDISDMESQYLWSGINDWRIMSFSIRAGIRNIKWEYIRGPYVSYDKNIAWIDLVVIPDKFNESLFNTEVKEYGATLSAYPNPFNPVTEIKFNLENTQNAELAIFDMKGRLTAEIFKGNLDKGNHSFQFDGSGLSSGIYYSVLKYGDKILSKRLILMK